VSCGAAKLTSGKASVKDLQGITNPGGFCIPKSLGFQNGFSSRDKDMTGNMF
jgi:hypothetical protein